MDFVYMMVFPDRSHFLGRAAVIDNLQFFIVFILEEFDFAIDLRQPAIAIHGLVDCEQFSSVRSLSTTVLEYLIHLAIAYQN